MRTQACICVSATRTLSANTPLTTRWLMFRGALLSCHDVWAKEKGPNALRATQRAQSRVGPEFLRLWARRKRARREYWRKERRVTHMRRRNKWANKEAAIKASNRAHLRANLAEIEAGRHGWWLTEFTRAYHPDELLGMVDDPETPLRSEAVCLSLSRTSPLW